MIAHTNQFKNVLYLYKQINRHATNANKQAEIMSSQSTADCDYLFDHGYISSSDTYSSGWDDSTTTDYFEPSDDEQEFYDDFCSKDDFYIPHKANPNKEKVFEREYKCELTTLSRRIFQHQPCNTISNETIKTEMNKKEVVVPTNPWKIIDKNIPTEDPWKFLETKEKEKKRMNNPTQKQQQHHRNDNRNNNYRRNDNRHRQDNRKKPVSLLNPIDNSNTNKLCKYKNECMMNRNGTCTMVHKLSEWKPRVCRLYSTCKRKNMCGYYHNDIGNKEYLRQLIRTKDTMYAKNAALYEKYLH